ncbi:MAG: ABC transporter permease [Gammaproteobacteria bacterium]|jgi:capsular polysaccharide transport system permease protein
MSLLAGLQPQLQVVHALVLRESRTRYGAHQLGYIWALLEPLFWVLTFYGIFYFANRALPFGMDIVSFITTGIIPYLLFRETVSKSLNAVQANKALLFYPQIRPLDLVIARVCLEIATLVTVFVIIMGAHSLYLGEVHIDDLLALLGGLLLAGLLGASLGIFFSALSVYTRLVERIAPILMRPLFFISGLFFTANELPAMARDVLLWNPVLHCVELVRDGWFPTYHAVHTDPTYVLSWILAFAYAGLILERMARRRLELT